MVQLGANIGIHISDDLVMSHDIVRSWPGSPASTPNRLHSFLRSKLLPATIACRLEAAHDQPGASISGYPFSDSIVTVLMAIRRQSGVSPGVQGLPDPKHSARDDTWSSPGDEPTPHGRQAATPRRR